MNSQENGVYVDQGQALGELIGQVCAAEGKFRQLNAIKEGTALCEYICVFRDIMHCFVC